ncbi:MAG TPA: transporter [Candidatus Binatia bacterium]|nr:transporter [Candidatus Binatia bacterium]
MRRSSAVLMLICFLSTAVRSHAQYKGDHIPGFTGLESGTQPPPGVYVGGLVWVYPTSTIKDNNGNGLNLPGGITSTAPILLVNVVPSFKALGGNIGASIAFPFIDNRIQFNSLDLNSGMAYTDMFAGLTLGWHLKRTDITAGYNLYMPTGSYSPNSNENSGLGMWGNEFSLGSTFYLDQKKMWNAAATFFFEFNSSKSGTDIRPGNVGTIEGGFGRTFYKKVSGPIPMIMNLGAAGYAQWKITNDSGSQIPPALLGYKDRVFGLGPEFSTYIPGPRLTFLARYEPEFGARVRSQGQTILFSVVWVTKSLVKLPSH